MVALAVLGVVVIVVIVPLLAGFVIFSDTMDRKPRGYRVRQVVGFAIVAAGASIMFLPVSTETDGFHVSCGSALGAMFSEWDNRGTMRLGRLPIPVDRRRRRCGGNRCLLLGGGPWSAPSGGLHPVACRGVDRPCRIHLQRRRRRGHRQLRPKRRLDLEVLGDQSIRVGFNSIGVVELL